MVLSRVKIITKGGWDRKNSVKMMLACWMSPTPMQKSQVRHGCDAIVNPTNLSRCLKAIPQHISIQKERSQINACFGSNQSR